MSDIIKPTLRESLSARRQLPGAGTALAALTMLTACGGGGGGSVVSAPPSQPVPPSVPAPVPAPAPAPAPTSGFDTDEFNRSDGPDFHGALAAYRAGATGQGVTIGIIDSGIDPDSPEFAGRIAPGSMDFVGNRGLQDEGGHGTQVAQIAAGARNNSGTLGIAFNSQILVLKADEIGSCLSTQNPDDNGCSYSNSAIASAFDRAVASGARVVNLSLGGAVPPFQVREAVSRATRAGVIVVVSAGNNGDTVNDPDVDPNNPDPFATGLLEAGNGLVIIAGSVDKNRQISDFSNRAGRFGTAYLTALGEEVCCVYENGTIKITRDDAGRSFVTVVSGTSFSAPQIAGAAALLAQAFPNLTGQQIVDLLLRTGRDAGAVGTDAVYGRGILDIAAAFQPQGTTSLAGTNTAVPLAGYTGTTSAPMGDATQRGQSLNAVILDSYQRAYAIDLGGSVRSAQLDRKLDGALSGRAHTMVAAGGQAQIALTIAAMPDGFAAARPLELTGFDTDRARILAGSVQTRIAPGTQLGFGVKRGADGLTASLQGQDAPAFLIADAPRSGTGFASDAGGAVALRQEIGGFGITGTLESGRAVVRDNLVLPDKLAGQTQYYGYDSAGIAFDKSWTGGSGRGGGASLGLTRIDEKETILGGKFTDAFGGGGAVTYFADAAGRLDLGRGWQAGLSWRQGLTRVRSGGALAGGSQLWSSAFAADIGKTGLVTSGDTLSFRFSQPLRVSSGGLRLTLPVSYDYATRQTIYDTRTLNLAPGGRELVSEMRYARALWGGYMSANLYYRTDPGHYAALPDDQGAAIQFQTRF